MSIQVTQPTIELIEAIEAAGHFLYRRDGQWVCSDEQAVQALIDEFQPTPPVLTPDRFLYLKALLGAVTLWDQLERALEEQNSPWFPLIYAQRGKSKFELSRTLQLIAVTKPIWSQLAPTIDLSPETVTSAWMRAAGDSL